MKKRSAPPPPAVIPLTPDAPLWAWATDALGERAGSMLAQLEGVRLGIDIEAVHDMRVASRRVAAAMRVFEGAFPERDFRRLRREARDVTRHLGEVRDLDVQIDYFERCRPKAAAGRPELTPALDYLLARKRREHTAARQPMLASLAALEASDYPERLRRFLARAAAGHHEGRASQPAVTEQHLRPESPFREAAPFYLEQRYHALYAFEPYVHQPEAEEPLHDMRIAAKWLRYTMELFAPAYADQLKQPLSAVKRLQELLGDLHDSDVRRALVAAQLADPLDWRSLEEIGLLSPLPVERSLRRLLAEETETRQGIYRDFAKEWNKLDRRGFASDCLERIRTPDA